MSVINPQFLTAFLVAWVSSLAYVVTFTIMARRRKVLSGGPPVPLLQSFLSAANPVFTLGDLRFLFSAEHQLIGDAVLSRTVLIARALFLITAALFAVVVTMTFSRGAADVG